MNVLDLDGYRDALAADGIKIGGEVYPLRLLKFNDALSFSAEVDNVDFSQPDAGSKLIARFAELAGIPEAVLAEQSFSAVMAGIRYFLGSQLNVRQESYDQAIASAAGASTS